MEYREAMVDLETIDNEGSSAIISAGFVLFNLDEEDNYQTLEEDGRCFEVVFDVQEQLDLGRTASFGTIKWWMEQNVTAQAVFQKKPTYQSNTAALRQITKFLAPSKAHAKNRRLWGNGVRFDNEILYGMFKVYDMQFPTEFWNDMCYRTLKNISPPVTQIERGVEHDALDDAKYQVIMAQQFFKALYAQQS